MDWGSFVSCLSHLLCSTLGGGSTSGSPCFGFLYCSIGLGEQAGFRAHTSPLQLRVLGTRQGVCSFRLPKPAQNSTSEQCGAELEGGFKRGIVISPFQVHFSSRWLWPGHVTTSQQASVRNCAISSFQQLILKSRNYLCLLYLSWAFDWRRWNSEFIKLYCESD